ncbi:DNA polymerase epsilon subunit C [Nymphaea thermarum]|nr:DNA polymerase epsilon subunit C [Nymphaea thermarum]
MADEGEDATGAQEEEEIGEGEVGKEASGAQEEEEREGREEEEEIGEGEVGKEASGAQEEEEREGREEEEEAQGKHEEEGRGGGREEEEEEGEEAGDLIDIFPRARVRKIMRIDPDINKMTSEALTLVSRSTVLFLRHLAEASAAVTLRRKKRIVRLEHIRDAVRSHHPTSDFLLDCLPPPAVETATDRPKERPRVEKPAPPGNRRIDDFFRRG